MLLTLPLMHPAAGVGAEARHHESAQRLHQNDPGRCHRRIAFTVSSGMVPSFECRWFHDGKLTSGDEGSQSHERSRLADRPIASVAAGTGPHGPPAGPERTAPQAV
ncbi:hypothetical protein GCM10009828_066180 [Actinoplanes couchii]|uniref:Ig-like domain-containing protein n=1 Tax=Actinoplanes couchii TaxID=403638 RepID=A0ABQ3X2L8_9ACTN|nr:hypothetical protein Aco03nite_011660 [Actinoplanes couchii]